MFFNKVRCCYTRGKPKYHIIIIVFKNIVIVLTFYKKCDIVYK